MVLSEHYKALDVKTYLVSHLDPLTLSNHFWSRIDEDSLMGHSLELLHKSIEREIEHFETGDPDIDDVFFNMLTIDGMYEIVVLKILDISILVHCHDGVYREMPSIIMTVRNKSC